MPRANRHFLPGHVWHLTHRCHQKSFLLRFARDRRCYLRWMFEAKKRFGLSVLNYMVTSNHIHLLVKDTGQNAIAQSMQLIAGRTAQEYNQRKGRQGAFWEDRYHATAIEAAEHLHRCLVYIDLNMVRAGVVDHPAEWAHSGYREIQEPPGRYAIIDLRGLMALCGFAEVADFQLAHRQWIEESLPHEKAVRDERWSRAIAVGSLAFVDNVRSDLGIKAMHREVAQRDGTYILREQSEAYGEDFASESDSLTLNNTISWEENIETVET
jgi:putative transposase